MWFFNSLPEGVKKINGVYEVNGNIVYPKWIKLLRMHPDRYSVEVVRRSITEQLRSIVGKPITVNMKADKQWKAINLVEGKGLEAASVDFRNHYNWLKNNKLI